MNELALMDKGADWRRLKALVLDSVSSPITKRVYNLGLDEFFDWYGQQPRPGFHDLERLRKKYFRHVVCVIGDDLLRVLAVAKPWVGLAACRVVRPGGHKRIPVDPPPGQPDLKQDRVVQPVRLPMARKHTKTLMTEKDGIRGLVPARNRGYRDRVFAEYLDTLNPRANVVMQKALAASPDVRFQEFLDRVMTPKYLSASLATIAKGCGIDLLEFNQWWSKASAQRAIAEAQLASPGVVEDLIEDAKSKDDVCDRCDGIGSVAAPPGLAGDIPGYRLAREASEEHGAIYTRTCPKCAGEGTVRRSGDAHARDQSLEIAGLSSGAKGAAVAIQNFSGASHGSAVPILEDAMSILDVKAERLAEDEAVDEAD